MNVFLHLTVVKASYDLVIVDEYQDCVVEQHNLVLALHKSLPICVFGDPLQNIFNFGKNVPVKWANDVTATWGWHLAGQVPGSSGDYFDAYDLFVLSLRDQAGCR